MQLFQTKLQLWPHPSGSFLVGRISFLLRSAIYSHVATTFMQRINTT